MNYIRKHLFCMTSMIPQNLRIEGRIHEYQFNIGGKMKFVFLMASFLFLLSSSYALAGATKIVIFKEGDIRDFYASLTENQCQYDFVNSVGVDPYWKKIDEGMLCTYSACKYNVIAEYTISVNNFKILRKTQDTLRGVYGRYTPQSYCEGERLNFYNEEASDWLNGLDEINRGLITKSGMDCYKKELRLTYEVSTNEVRFFNFEWVATPCP